MSFYRFRHAGFGPFGFRVHGPLGFAAFGGFGRARPFRESAAERRRHQLRWLRRYREDLQEELSQVEQRIKELEGEAEPAGE